MSVAQATEYPRDGRISIRVTGLSGKKLAVRIPGRCPDYQLTSGGESVMNHMEAGYAVCHIEREEYTLDRDFAMPVTLIESSPLVREDAGKVAVQRGPVIYCAEEVDNGAALWALEADSKHLNPRVEESTDWLYTVIVQGRRQLQGGGLYHPLSPADYVPREIRLIPYYAFANRGESEMAVWLRKF